MINANELRIGNWVESDGKYITVFHIDRDDDGGWINYVGEDQYNPIPLTPEILEKCGFVKDRNGWTLPNTDLSLTDNMYPCWIDKMLWPQDVAGYKEYSLTSLHQLQNLYFCLCGKELEVKL